MPFTIQIAGKSLKVDSEIIVGRGAPFENLDEHLDVARAHVQIICKKEQLQIKDLGTESGTTLNGMKLKANKFYPLTSKDEVMLGSVPLKIQRSFTATQVENIQRFSNEGHGKIAFHHLYVGLYVVIMILYYTSSTAKYDLRTIIASFIMTAIMSLIIAIPIWIGSRLGGFLFPNKHKLYIGKKGFTVHHPSSNMSLLFSNIEEIIFKPFSIELTAHGETVTIMHIDKKKELKEILKNNCPGKWKNNHMDYLYMVGGFFLGLGLVMSNALDHKDPTRVHNFQMYFGLIMGSIFLLAAVSPKFLSYIYKMSSKNHPLSKSRMALASFLCFALSYDCHTNILNIKKQQVVAQQCLNGDATQCRNVDHYLVSDLGLDKPAKMILLEKACSGGVRGACNIIMPRSQKVMGEKKRLPASSSSASTVMKKKKLPQ